MNHLFALIGIIIFRRRSKLAVNIWPPNGWKWSALALGIIGALPGEASADGTRVSVPSLQAYACDTIMGLNPSEAQYVACVSSLSESLAAAYRKKAISSDARDVALNRFQRACAEIGIRPYSRPFKKCVIELSVTLFKLDSIPGR